MCNVVNGYSLLRFPLIRTMTYSENARPTAVSGHNLDLRYNRKFPDVLSELSYSFKPLYITPLLSCPFYLYRHIDLPSGDEMGRICLKFSEEKKES